MENENTIIALREITELVKEQAIENLVANKSYVSGDLAKSIYTNVDEQNLVGEVGVGEWYGVVVEKGLGRGAGKMPPIAPIKDWIKRRGLTPKPGTTIDGFAIAIAKKIGGTKKKNGTGTNPKARPFLAPAVEQIMQSHGTDLLELAVSEDINETLVIAYEKNS